MLDIRLIRKDPEGVQKKLETKEAGIDLSKALLLDAEIREGKTEVEKLKSERNVLSKKIGELKRAGEDATEVMNQAGESADRIHAIDRAIAEKEDALNAILSCLPNIPTEDTKVSPDPADNVVIKEVGEKRGFDFPSRNHVELNERLNLFDFKRGAKISGTGWPVYRGLGARLEWALLNYMLETQIKNGFEMWMPPLLVREDVLFGSGQLPKFEGQYFKLGDEQYPLQLIPTAEVPLNGLHMGEILSEEELPLCYTAYTPCFRREAGAAGAGERGLIRIHQFNKVEMFCYAKPEESDHIFQKMVASAEEVISGLGLHYRICDLVTGDQSFAAAKTWDLEVYLPGQQRYYEVSSVSHCTDFQARRSETRFRRKEGGKPEFVHTLNGSGLATSRLMVSLLENNQNPDGSVNIPEVLQGRMGGIEKIEPAQEKVVK